MRVAIRGEWKFRDAEFLTGVVRIAQGHRRFWQDADAPFLVTMTHLTTLDPGWTSIGGTGLDDAFAFIATPNVELKFSDGGKLRIFRTAEKQTIPADSQVRLRSLADAQGAVSGG